MWVGCRRSISQKKTTLTKFVRTLHTDWLHQNSVLWSLLIDLGGGCSLGVLLSTCIQRKQKKVCLQHWKINRSEGHRPSSSNCSTAIVMDSVEASSPEVVVESWHWNDRTTCSVCTVTCFIVFIAPVKKKTQKKTCYISLSANKLGKCVKQKKQINSFSKIAFYFCKHINKLMTINKHASVKGNKMQIIFSATTVTLK